MFSLDACASGAGWPAPGLEDGESDRHLLHISLLFCYSITKKKKIFSDFCQVCSDFQSVTLLDRFFFFSENLHLFWKTECDPPPSTI